MVNALLRAMLLLLISLPTLVVSQPASQYRLAAGDVIRISVFGEPDLSFEKIRLTDAGTFSFPFIGSVLAQGKTTGEIEAFLSLQLKGDYLIEPRVSVNILEYREFFISGEVKAPGAYPYQPNLTLRRAIAIAGGLTDRASERRISIIRDASQGTSPRQVSLETPLFPGDTVSIGSGFF